MAKEVTMPKLAMTQETGTILQWYKAEGEAVEQGDPLLEVMTNKINIDVEAYDSGVLLKRLYETGAEVPVLQVIAYIGEAGEQIPSQTQSASEPEQVSSGASGDASAKAVDKAHHAVTADQKLRATPAARALAREHGVNLADVKGSGSHGRIHRDDVQAFTEQRQAAVAASPAERRSAEQKPASSVSVNQSTAACDLTVGDTVVPVSGMRKVIGERMAQSAFTAPHVTLTTEVDMLAANQLRQQMMGIVGQQTGARLSVNVVVLKAVAVALRKHPNVNATWRSEQELVWHKAVHLGMAVAIPNGLVVPVIRDAHAMGFGELTTASKQLAKDAREGRLAPDVLAGGTFTVSNLGMYGVEGFTPIINPPQAAILGVGGVLEKAAAVNGQLEVRPRMTLSLSFDHRALDGAEAAEFLRDLKMVLEEPLYLLA